MPPLVVIMSLPNPTNMNRVSHDSMTSMDDRSESSTPDADMFQMAGWSTPDAFTAARHTQEIRGEPLEVLIWRMKERTKTVSVALVLCLNVGTDPPDIIKTVPCARIEAGIDPQTMVPHKAIETIGANLQQQYERWQPRARYKLSLDPTVEEVKKLCVSLRRNAKDERVLFHYNGHGVPKPTVNGEIWVFNRSYTQYIPLSLYDLQQWMGTPAIYVYDCSNAGIILETFIQFAVQRERENDWNIGTDALQTPGTTPVHTANGAGSDGSTQVNGHVPETVAQNIKQEYRKCIQLAACAKDQILPMNPDLPADLFTACLTTPIKIGLQWFIKQNAGRLLPGVTLELLEKIPGQLGDRRTMLGELNWIFTAITDTIAWNVLPQKLFQQLFRQDLLVASLFRNFLLADRIMRSYNCTPVSSPRLPPTCHHPMWHAWDLAVDQCLSQLPQVLSTNPCLLHRACPFFSDQLTAFQVWLSLGDHQRSQPEQLPIVLQVLLSQAHRLRALDLLSQFLDLGPWAVNLALSVGIFPYVLKLLQSSCGELRPLLVFIWSKILAVDSSCQTDLVGVNGHKYFISILSDSHIPSDYKTMAAFVLSVIVRNNPQGQEAAFQNNLIATCLEQLNESNGHLRRWTCICLGHVWEKYDAAYWCGVRDSAHEKLLSLLEAEQEPEVRAAAVFALGTFVNSATERTDHSNTIDQRIGLSLIQYCLNDGSPLVRKELVVALQMVIFLFETQILTIQSSMDAAEPDPRTSYPTHMGSPDTSGSSPQLHTSHTSSSSLRIITPTRDNRFLKPSLTPVNTSSATASVPFNMSSNIFGSDFLPTPKGLKRISSMTSLSVVSGIGMGYVNMWKAMYVLASDPYPEVSKMAEAVVDEIKSRLHFLNASRSRDQDSIHSSPAGAELKIGSPPDPPTGTFSNRPPLDTTPSGNNNHPPHLPPSCRSRPTTISNGADAIREKDDSSTSSKRSVVSTDFVNWSAKYFINSILKSDLWDPESPSTHQKEYTLYQYQKIRDSAQAEIQQESCRSGRIDELIFTQKSQTKPNLISTHPYEPHMIVAEKNSFSLWSWDALNTYGRRGANSTPVLMGTQKNHLTPFHKITSMELLNPHSSTLVLLGSDDGSVKIWTTTTEKNDMDNSCRLKSKLISAFQMFGDCTPTIHKNSGSVLHWEQDSCQIIAGGDYKFIRIWDSHQETKIRDIPTDCDQHSVTSIKSDGELICAGCSDGTIRIFDRREPNGRVRPITFREHEQPIVTSYIFPNGTKHVFAVSGCRDGEVKFWDKRILNSIKTIKVSTEMTAMSIHPEVDLIACGSCSPTFNSINIYTLDGFTGSTIKSSDSFMGQRMGPVSCLSFHPLRAQMAVGTSDNSLLIYSARVN